MLGDNLKKIRNVKGFTQVDLSKKCGLSETSIWKIETGKCDPSAGTLRKLAEALGVKVGIFFEDSLNFSQEDRKAV